MKTQIVKIKETKNINSDTEVFKTLNDLKSNIAQYENLIQTKNLELSKCKDELQSQNEEMNKVVRPDLINFRKKYERMKTQLAETKVSGSNLNQDGSGKENTNNNNNNSRMNNSTLSNNNKAGNTSLLKNSNTSHDLFISKTKLNRH